WSIFRRRLGLVLESGDLETDRDRLEAYAKARRVWRGRYLGEPPGLPEVALLVPAIGIRGAVVLVHQPGQRHAGRIELEVALRMRAQHQETNHLGRVDRHDLDRFGPDSFGARHFLRAEREELMLQAWGRIAFPHLAL